MKISCSTDILILTVDLSTPQMPCYTAIGLHRKNLNIPSFLSYNLSP